MADRRTTKKAVAKKAPAKRDATASKIAEKMYGPKVVREFTVDLEDIRLIQEAFDDLLDNTNSYGSITKVTMEVELSGGNVAEINADAPGFYGGLSGTVRLIERDT
jgi:hypothetical protein